MGRAPQLCVRTESTQVIWLATLVLPPSHLPPLPLVGGGGGGTSSPPARRQASEPLILPLTGRHLPVYTRFGTPPDGGHPLPARDPLRTTRGRAGGLALARNWARLPRRRRRRRPARRESGHARRRGMSLIRDKRANPAV